MNPRPARPTPAPLQTNDVATVGVGMCLWLVALGVLVGLQRIGGVDIPDWWIWTCVAGFGLGFYGLWFLWRRTVRAGDRARPPKADAHQR